MNLTFDSLEATNSSQESVFVPEVMFFNGLLLLFGLLALIGSCLILMVISAFSAFREEHPCVYEIGLLAAADALHGFGLLLASAERFRIWSLDLRPLRLECLLTSFPMLSGGIGSQLALACIALDRYSSIKDPLAYQARPDRLKTAVKQAAGIVLITSLLNGSAFIGIDPWDVPANCTAAGSAGKIGKLLWITLTLSIAAFIIIMYIILLVTVRKKLTANKNNQSVQAQNLRIQAKVTKVISMVLTVYITCWAIPVFIYDVVVFVHPVTAVRVAQYLALGSAASSAANIFIYIWRLSNFTVYLRKIFVCFSNNVVVPLQK